MFALILATLATPCHAGEIDIDINATLRLGKDVRIDSPVEGDVFAVGGTLVIDAPVKGDVNGLAEKFHITKQGSVEGTVRLVAEEMTIEGPVQGGIKGAAETLRLRSTIDGASDLAVRVFHAERGGAILGSLAYQSPARLPALEKITKGAIEWRHTTWEDHQFEMNFD